MLYRETVESHTLELLIELMDLDYFKDYRLVGGTALSLQYGHRKSIDLDFFGIPEFDMPSFEIGISSTHNMIVFRKSKFISQMKISNVKVDIVTYPYEWIEPAIVEGKIRMATDKEIAAMKVNAITNRGTKKDFVDLYALLLKYSFSEIMGFYALKYPDGNIMLALRSLIYFDDADEQSVDMIWDIGWNDIKSIISKKYFEYYHSL